MTATYNFADWYWIVGGDQTRAYSSKLGDYVLSGDATFVAWVGSHGAPTSIASEAELGEVLAQYLLRPLAANVLDGYKDAQSAGVVALVAFKVLFNHENRLRAVERALSLNGSPANLTAAQAKAAVKALM